MKYFNKIFILYFLFFIIPQDVYLSLLYNITSNKLIVSSLIVAKDLVMYFMLMVIIIKQLIKSPSMHFKIFTALFVYMLAMLIFVNDLPLKLKLYSFRSILLPFSLYYIGYNMDLWIDKRYFNEKLTFLFEKFIIICSIISLIFYIIPPDLIWLKLIGISNYLSEVKGYKIYAGYPGNYFNRAGGPLRLPGIGANPLTTAYYMAPFFIYYLIQQNKNRANIIKLLLISAVLYLTNTRAIVYLLILFTGYYLVNQIREKFIFDFKYKKVGLLIVGLLVVVTAGFYLKNHPISGSTLAHFKAMANGIEAVKNIDNLLIGNGIGTAGAAASMKQYKELDIVGTESAYLTIFIQMGIVGTIIFILFIAANLINMYNNKKYSYNYDNVNDIHLSIYYSSFIYIITGLISEQLLSFTTIHLFWLLFGYFSNRDNINQSYFR